MSHKRNIPWIAVMLTVLVAAMGASTLAGQVGTLNSFQSGAVASSNDVNANFSALRTEVNDNDDRISSLETRAAGFLDAAALVAANGSLVRTFWNAAPFTPIITASWVSVGVCEVNFGTDVSGRFYQATLGAHDTNTNMFAGTITVTPKAGSNQILRVVTTDSAGVFLTQSFYVLIH